MPRDPAPPDPISTRNYREVYDGVALPVLLIDHASWLILDANQAALSQYGYDRDEFVGLSALQVRPPEGRSEARKILSEMPHGVWKTTAVRHCRKDGSIFTADVWSRDTVVDGRPIRVATIHEVTDRVELQRELQQAQKMEVVGRLAGGVAHDFNNALTSIIGLSDLLLEGLHDRPDARADLETIQRVAQGAALLTRHLLAFSRQQVMRTEVCLLPELVQRTVAVLRRVMGDRIRLETRFEPGSWPVRIDPVQLEHVLMNLVVNAQDAMPEGGTVLIGLENLMVSGEDTRRHPTVPSGEYVCLEVHDTGVGMDEVTRARVFEPFFTTKPPPEGTGLGLSMAYGIIRQSDGFISVDSTPGEGTTFRILLPRADLSSIGEEAGHGEESQEGRGVLVVEGDDQVRRSTCRALEGLGYTVASAVSGEEALTNLERWKGAPDLLVTAVGLPGLDGRELADRLQAAHPGLAVLFVSGYALEGNDDLKGLERGRGLLQKPFSLESLTAAVRRLLGES